MTRSPPLLSQAFETARFAEGPDDDLGDEGLVRLQLAVAIRKRADDGELVFAHEIGEPDEPRAHDHDVSRGKRECQPVRRVEFGGRVGVEGVVQQLGQGKTLARIRCGLKLHKRALAALVALGFAFQQLFFEGGHKVGKKSQRVIVVMRKMLVEILRRSVPVFLWFGGEHGLGRRNPLP